jgi:7-cyano-7-deazaguanine reductase
MNFTQFESQQAFVETVERDLSNAAGGKVELQLFQVDDLEILNRKGFVLMISSLSVYLSIQIQLY